MIEHRRYPRFHLLHTTARAKALEAQVINVSRSGMLLETNDELHVGESLTFDVSDRNHRLTVSGEVRWIRLRDNDTGGTYRAGFRFARILSHDARGVWARLVAESGETGLPVGHRPEITSAGSGRVPLLTILAPEDGTVVRQGAVTVIGQVRDPGLGAMIEVNGVRALVYGRRFEARVPLLEGPNLLSAAVATSGSLVCRSPAIRVTRAPLDGS